MDREIQNSRAVRFLELHHSHHILVLPNAWDATSARIFAQAGFSAIGTTSAGIAASLGYPDGQHIGLPWMREAVQRITRVVSIPVSADIEAGYGDTPEDLENTAREVIRMGAVGLNLEDSSQNSESPLIEIGRQVDKIRAVRAVADKMDIPLVINARTDVYLKIHGEAGDLLDQAVRRANAYHKAGADCLFVIGVQDKETIVRLVHQINGPVNVLAGKGSPTIPELQELGVARVSFGAGPMRATLTLLKDIASELKSTGTYSFSERALSHAEMDRLFTP
ncbi:MAG: isocitrate lyase/phosphoenolpyruvate mutase family protein [Anaerolineaceae bacterium]|nr:isocitrate lyase/phosphoenolpyruvate mutase family protein [Anaerolineaceae bacterium]